MYGENNIRFDPIFRFDDLLTLFCDYISLDKEIDVDDKYRIIRESLYSCKKSKKEDIIHIKRQIARNQSEFLRQPIEKYFLLTRIYLPRKNGERIEFSFRGVRILIQDYHPRSFKTTKFMFSGYKEVNLNHPPKFSALYTSVSARSYKEAARKAMDVIRCLVATSNFVLSGASRRVSSEGYKPFAVARLSKFQVIYNPDKSLCEDYIIYDPYFDIAPTLPFLSHRGEALKSDIIPLMRKIEKLPIGDIIWQALCQIDKGAHSHDQEVALIQTWSGLEIATGSSNGQEVSRRASFLSYEPQLRKARLSYISKVRNTIMHEGNSDWREAKVIDELRVYTCMFIHALINIGSDFKNSSELMEFLSYPTNVSDLNRRIYLLKKAQKMLSR